MRTSALTILLAAGTLGAAAGVVVPRDAAPAAVRTEQLAPAQKIRLPQRSDGALTADFSRRGASDETVVWSENFDAGIDAWTADEGENVTWMLQNAPSSFSTIDPANVWSLYVDTPYQIFKRETCGIVSPEITVPQNAMLRCQAFFTLNWQDECALEILISTDNFETSERLYTSLDETGERPAMWRQIAASLAGYAGQTVRIKFLYTYGREDEIFKVGGYMGDFYIDDVRVSGAVPVTRIDVTTGENVEFVDLSEGNPTEWEWTMPGAVPETSTEQNPTVYYTRDGVYDVTLRVRDAEGHEAQATKTALVSVTGTAPTAHILPPATFRFADTRKYMVAPMARVTFRDASEGFPTSFNWGFSGVTADNETLFAADTQSVDVSYWFQHDWMAALEVSNQHGTSSDSVEVSAEYEGSVNNLRPSDTLTTFDLEGSGTFPGSNSMGITAYAEKFSAPSVPVVIPGVTVFFTKSSTVEVIDQIADIGVHLYTSENGRPGKKIDSDWVRAFELNISADPSTVSGTQFNFTSMPVVRDEFFIVIDGIPDTRYEADVRFAMASFRADGGTAWMLKDGEWREVTSYFPAGANHTSYAIYPYVRHSVMAPYPQDASDTVEVGADAGQVTYPFFSYMGYETPLSDADWCRVVSEPNGMTLDELVIAYDTKPDSQERRTAHITLTDGLSEYVITLIQKGVSGIEAVEDEQVAVTPTLVDSRLSVTAPAGSSVRVFNAAGALTASTTVADGSLDIDAAAWAPGIYFVNINNSTFKVIKK